MWLAAPFKSSEPRRFLFRQNYMHQYLLGASGELLGTPGSTYSQIHAPVSGTGISGAEFQTLHKLPTDARVRQATQPPDLVPFLDDQPVSSLYPTFGGSTYAQAVRPGSSTGAAVFKVETQAGLGQLYLSIINNQ